MTYKTILVHCDASSKLAQRLEVAADLAGRYDAHLVGVHVRMPFEAPVFSDVVLRVEALHEAYRQEAEAAHDQAAAAFAKATQGSHLSSEWRTVEGYPEEQLAVHGRYADLVVVGQTDPDEPSPFQTPPDLPEVVAISTARPTLVVPHIGVQSRIGKAIMLCWNASRESAHAATEALPLMVSAERVIVLVVDPRTSASEHGPEPGADAAGWLARHGVKVTVQRDLAVDADAGNAILSRAADLGIDLIVMGLYGHSRMREVILGGASRTLLASMTVPVLMAH
jgi:nucleotide-binding universal stress UspA family protein